MNITLPALPESFCSVPCLVPPRADLYRFLFRGLGSVLGNYVLSETSELPFWSSLYIYL